MNVLITGGAGFIGSAFARLLCRERPSWKLVVFDKLTYAGNRRNLEKIEGSYTFVRGDIADTSAVRVTIRDHAVDTVVNFAAESHVDRSILDGLEFAMTDVIGTVVLLTEARRASVRRYVQVSTDEVYGAIPVGAATEESPLRPSNPYSAAKAGGDFQVHAAHHTYGFPTLITRGSNTYGQYQYPEKIIPLFITNLLEGRSVPLYGTGRQRREWFSVDDHARGILAVLERGVPGTVYNLGSGEECDNLTLARMILAEVGKGEDMIEYVADRPGHDERYALDSSRARSLGWSPTVSLASGLKETIQWFQAHADWWGPLKQREAGAFARAYAAREVPQ